MASPLRNHKYLKKYVNQKTLISGFASPLQISNIQGILNNSLSFKLNKNIVFLPYILIIVYMYNNISLHRISRCEYLQKKVIKK